MSAFHRFPTVSAIALALLAAASVAGPAGAQEGPERFQQRPHPQQRGQGPHAQGPQAQGPHGPGQRLQPPQEAQRRRGGDGAGIAAGVIGGLAAGALLGGALSDRGGYAEPGYAEEVEGGPRYGGGCPLVRRPVYDGAGQFAGYQSVPSC